MMQNFRPMPSCQPVGMVYGKTQVLESVYQPAQALMNGTLFPELNKPMNGACTPTSCGPTTEEQALAFAAWELRLYLNTHPSDQKALHFYRQICQQMHTPNYACTFAPCASGAWEWVEDPWPWECAANERRG